MSDSRGQFLLAERPKNKIKNKKRIIMVISALIVVIGGIMLIIITSSINSNNAQNQKKSDNKPSAIKIDNPTKIRAELGNTTDQSKKDRLYQDLIASLQLENDLDGAITATIEYSDMVKTADSYGLLAGIYETKGDKSLAKTYFQKALDLSEKTDLDQRSPYSYYYDKLQTLKDI